MPAAVSTAASPANTTVSRRIRMNGTSGSPMPNRASNQTPEANTGASITRPVKRPLKKLHRGGKPAGIRVLALGRVGSGIAVPRAVRKEDRQRDHRSMLGAPPRGTPGPPIQSRARMASIPEKIRSYAAAHFALELDGKTDGGLFRSIEGGSVKLDVMTYQQGGNYYHARQLGKPKFEDIKLQVGMSMSALFFAWIQDFFVGKANRKNGAVVAADFYYNERARREFTNAMIKELTFPKLDGSDKNAAYLSISLAVESLAFVAGRAGVKLDRPSGFDSQKLWTACDFDFVLSGFNCDRVSKIDSFTVKQTIIEYHMGGQLSPTKTPSQIDFPNLGFYIP